MRRISSGSRFEELAAYSRAVVDDRYVFISGTTGSDPVSGEMPEDVRAQMANIFATIEQTLREAGSRLEAVTRCRVFLTDQSHLTEVVEVLREKFDDCRPANTTLICQIPAPGAKVEIEVTARLDADVQ